MRYLVVLIAALAIGACSKPAGTNTHEASMPATLEFLLASAAADFHAHPPGEALRFYNVNIGHLVNSEGAGRYMLCGDFSANQGSGHGERTPFATVDSPGGPNGYQQLLGGQATIPCDDPSATFDSEVDLSPSLQNRFDSL